MDRGALQPPIPPCARGALTPQLIYDVEKEKEKLHPIARILKDSIYFRALDFQRIVMNNENV